MTAAPIMSEIEIIQKTVSELARRDAKILGVYLFGSRADGSAGPDSDVDLAVLFRERENLEQLVELQIAFERNLGREVDLIDLGRAGAYLALDAIRGERVYCADEHACDNFDLYVMRRAADLAPFERERRRRLLGLAA